MRSTKLTDIFNDTTFISTVLLNSHSLTTASNGYQLQFFYLHNCRTNNTNDALSFHFMFSIYIGHDDKYNLLLMDINSQLKCSSQLLVVDLYLVHGIRWYSTLESLSTFQRIFISIMNYFFVNATEQREILYFVE